MAAAQLTRSRVVLGHLRPFGAAATEGIRHTPPPDPSPAAEGKFTLGPPPDEAYLSYHLLGQGTVIDMAHTVVPPKYRGQKIAEKLCDAAFALARQRGLKVLPSCSYISSRYVPARLPELAGSVLCWRDAGTPGLEISISRAGVATCLLADPRRRNPITRPVLARLLEFLKECGKDPEVFRFNGAGLCDARVKVVVIESTGPVWCTGHDFKDFAERERSEQKQVLDLCTAVNLELARVPQLTVAAVAGRCLAGARALGRL